MRLFLKNLLFTLVAPGTVAGLVPYLIVSRQADPWPETWGVLQFIGIPLMAAGALVYARCVWDFARRGRGTPAPIDAPKVLVVQGLYRYVRNPMYVGVLLVILGEVLFFTSPALAAWMAFAFLAVHLFTIFYEEPTLQRLFGDAYARYRRAVRRWIPGRPYRGA